MSLFDQVLGALENPEQQANPDQLSGILTTADQVGSSYGADSGTTQSVLSLVGNYVKSALLQKQMTGGQWEAQAIVNRFSGTTADPQAVQTLLPPNVQEQLIDEASQRTGLNPTIIQSMLPVLIPLVLNFLRSGNTHSAQAGNPVLDSFLNPNDNEGIGDAIGFIGRFFNQRG
ncbi:MAG: hypothetical protein VKJ46_10640 [Leptolyngbyaceae bacterium]|nr:hypothetical protein [Leptolyngbyaceae bacterium]